MSLHSNSNPFRTPSAGVWWILVGLVVWLGSSGRASAHQVRDPSLGFTVTIPSTFVAVPNIAAANRDFIYGFRRTPLMGGMDSMIVIERMNGVITRKRLSPSDLPPGLKGKTFLVPWNAFQVEAFEIPEIINGVQTITYNVQVPLEPSAIQIKFLGPRADAAELRQLMINVLGSLKGQSNWIPSILPASINDAGWFPTALIGCGILILVAAIIGIWRIGRRHSWSIAFAVACGFIMTGFVFTGFRIREVMVVSGAIRLSGFVGLLVAPMTAIGRQRKPPQTVKSGSDSLQSAEQVQVHP
jgi:hypothetical protein